MSLVEMNEQLCSQERLEALANDLGVIWGAEAIGKAIGRTKRQTFYLLEKGALRGATKIGNLWCITLGALRANFDPDAAADAKEAGHGQH